MEWNAVSEQALSRMLYELERAGPYVQQMADSLPEVVPDMMGGNKSCWHVAVPHLRSLQTVHQQFTAIVDKIGNILTACQAEGFDAVTFPSSCVLEPEEPFPSSPTKK